MSYSTIAKMAQDPPLMLRCRAAFAAEAQYNGNSAQALMKHFDLSSLMWLLAAAPNWASAWESALASTRAPTAPAIGDDGAVITDGMILAAVKAVNP